MVNRVRVTALLAAVMAVSLSAQGPTADQVAQERAQAEREVPRLAGVLELKPGMTVADVGAGFGALTMVMAKWLGPDGHVFATDVADRAIEEIRASVTRERLENVTVLQGAAAATNLPAACCDAIFMRDVYHHLTEPVAFNASLAAALKPGGRLAIIDFVPRPGSKLFPGVNPNRGGHGIGPPLVIAEVGVAGLRHEQTVDPWPDAATGLYLTLFRK